MENDNEKRKTYRIMCRTEHWYAQYDLSFERGENRKVVQEYASKEEADWKLLQMFNEAAAAKGAGPFWEWEEAVAWDGATSLLRAEGQRRDGSRGYRDKMYSFYTEECKPLTKKKRNYNYYDKRTKN
jgi:hypothetical protein